LGNFPTWLCRKISTIPFLPPNSPHGADVVTAILLDTHVFLWLVSTPDRIPPPVRETLADQANELFVSFDRMIVAQAARRNFTIATSDSRMIDGALTPVLDTRRAKPKRTTKT
jgi:hypothetical protein